MSAPDLKTEASIEVDVEEVQQEDATTQPQINSEPILLERIKQRWANLPQAVRMAIIGLFIIFGLVLAGSFVFLALGSNSDIISLDDDETNADSNFIIADNGGVAGDCEVCAKVGVSILKELNGNAIDAAIASILCVGVVQPFSSGIGGGLVMNIHTSDGESIIIDARETASHQATPDMFVGQEEKAQFGALACATPAEIKGLYTAWEMYGSLEWKVLVEPSIPYAEEHVINELDIEYLNDAGFEKIDASPELKELYIRDGEFVTVGDVIHRPKLAETLRRIAEGGQEVFYTGDLAADIAEEFKNAGGIISREDLATYSVVIRDPVVMEFAKKYRIVLAPPPFGGVVFAMAMNIIEGFIPLLKQDDVTSEHLMIESWKWAFDDRLELGDPAFTENINTIVQTMTSKPHAKTLRDKIMLNATFPPEYYTDLVNVTAITHQLEDHGTMHLNVMDHLGNTVAVTSTVNLQWGSKFVGPKTGIVYNNQMDDFATPNLINYFEVPPAEANYISPLKRPLSSMNPLIVFDKDTGKSIMAAGASGGTRIITAPMQVVLNCLLYGDTAGEAIDRHRLHHQLFPDHIFVEEGYDQEQIDGLIQIGHQVQMTEKDGVSAAILKKDDKFQLASDTRKSAKPAGY